MQFWEIETEEGRQFVNFEQVTNIKIKDSDKAIITLVNGNQIQTKLNGDALVKLLDSYNQVKQLRVIGSLF